MLTLFQEPSEHALATKFLHLITDVFFINDNAKSLALLAMTNKYINTVIHSTYAYQVLYHLHKVDRYDWNPVCELLCDCGSHKVASPTSRTKCRRVESNLKYIKYYCKFKNIDHIDLFYKSCCCGYLDVAKWLHKTFNVTYDDVISAFFGACKINDLYTAEWLSTTFDFASNMEFDDYVDILTFFCVCGLLDIIKWLYKKIGFTYKHIRNGMKWACLNGHLEVTKWIHTTFNLERKYYFSYKVKNEDYSASQNNFLTHKVKYYFDNDFLCDICQFGQLNVLKWLHSMFNITLEEVRANNNEASCVTCIHNHLDMTKWLYTTFNLTTEDAYEVLRISRCHNDVTEWLTTFITH